MYIPHQGQQEHDKTPRDNPLILPLNTLDRTILPLVGGKAANLGELIQAGFSVPPGFCVTTQAYARASIQASLDSYLTSLSTFSSKESHKFAELTEGIRNTLRQTPLPKEIIQAVTLAYQELSPEVPLPVSVRSSATAEDLPEASFAGQQETYLNIIGIEALLSSIQRCFASLWTDRATLYRASLSIAPQNVSIAVVVQQMVESQVAGILFTANPLSGKRRQTVIEANPGLGESVVSGMTNPDYFVVQTTTGEIIERRLGDKQVIIQAHPGGGVQKHEVRSSTSSACLSDDQLRSLAALGTRVEARYHTPQDIEWAIDPTGEFFLLQTRPITTLFPLPPEAPSTDENLRVYLAFGVQQGTCRPFTPCGISALGLLSSGFLSLIGLPLSDPLSGPTFLTEAASRPYFDVTAALRSPFGRRFLLQAMTDAEINAATSFEHLVFDPRLSLVKKHRHALTLSLMRLLLHTRLPWYLLLAIIAPGRESRRVLHFIDHLRNSYQVDPSANAEAWLAAAEHLLLHTLRLAFRISPTMLAGMLSYTLARKMLGQLASESECQATLGGSPTNPTIQMNLALWQISRDIKADAMHRQLFQRIPTGQLAKDYLRGALPSPLQQHLTDFLHLYGHQSICELDIGVPRWSEDPTYVLNLLSGYLEMEEDTHSPDLKLQRTKLAASTMISRLTRRAAQKRRFLAGPVHFFLQRAHALAGFREMTRFAIGLLLARTREHLLAIGVDLVQAGRLDQAVDIFFLCFPEIHAALSGIDLRATINERRIIFDHESGRRHVPLVLLSDGTEPQAKPHEPRDTNQSDHELKGMPASPGIVTASAMVIHDPYNARLKPGEILVAPSTDPGWTPLFLKASGLVMEAGGAMAHGAIVAREYGIPAIVGVTDATTRIKTGDHLTIDGSTGTVSIESNK